MKRRKHWYRIHVGECPVCGRDGTWRERVYGRKPKSPKRRYTHDGRGYCGCIRV